jgi:hypothetical protein
MSFPSAPGQYRCTHLTRKHRDRLLDDLHASIATLDRTVNSYSLSFAVLLITGAALGDRFGRRRFDVRDGEISQIYSFLDPSLFASFGLPEG